MRTTITLLIFLLASFSECDSSTLKVLCGNSSSVYSQSRNLTFVADVWNPEAAGSQCITVDADFKTFSATWRWPTGPTTGTVHSYPHINFRSNNLPVALSDIASVPFKATWNMQMSAGPNDLASVKATSNVAVDMFADADPGAAQNETKAGYEIMIWLGSFSAPQPLGYDANHPCLTQTVGDIHFNLYCGVNTAHNIKTFSWLSTDNITTPNFDINLLLLPLWKNNLVPSNIKLGLVEFGTETFYAADNVTFSVSDFAMNVTTDSSTTNSSTKPHSSDSPPSHHLFVWYFYTIWSGIAVIIVSWI